MFLFSKFGVFFQEHFKALRELHQPEERRNYTNNDLYLRVQCLKIGYVDNVDLSNGHNHCCSVGTADYISYSETQEHKIANSGLSLDRLMPLTGRKAGRDNI